MPKAPEPFSTCQKTTKSLPRISPKSYCYNAVPNRFLAHFSASRTNGPRSLSQAKASTHSASPTGSHTAAYTAKHGAISPSATAWLCAVSEIATERTAGESGCTPYGVCPLSSASRPRWAAQPGRCCFRSRERFSLAVFVPTVSSPAPAAVPVPLGTAVRSLAGSCRSAPGRTPPSSVPAPPARLR